MTTDSSRSAPVVDDRDRPEGKLGLSAMLGVVSAVGRKVLVFVYSVFFVRILGADLYGVFVAFETVARPLSVISAVGGQHLVVSEVVRARSASDDGRVSAVISAKVLLTLGLSAAAALLVAFFAADLQRLLGGFATLDGVFRTWSWWIIPLSLSTIVGGILVGFGRSSTMFVLTNIVEPLGRLAMLPVLWLLITNFEGTWRFILIPEVFGTVLIVIAGLAAVRLSGTARFSIRNGWPEVPRIALVGLPLLAHGIAGLTFTYTDRLMVGAMLGDAQALGVYNIALVLAGFLMLFHRSIVTVISPSVSAAVAQGDVKRVQQLYRESAETSFLLAAVGYLWLVLFGPEILSLFGSDFAAYSILLAVVTWGQLIDTFAGCGGYLLIARGKGHYLMYNSIATVVLNIGLNWVLIQRFGLLGAALATAISYAIKNGLIIAENIITDRLHPFTLYHLGTLATTVLVAVLLFVVQPQDVSPFLRGIAGLALSVVAVHTLLGRASELLPKLRRRAGTGS